ncbi:hypothetical protein M8C21_001502 [Ambrosia artemisiifolia]|uniref:PPM-type phosphatase domain-containing protein n=1 Tax=Ambrosia artemisiifolia TaxID=4212 RepID=A0AAD5GNH5_AMBAR|nr:hypothetical protein M8C21_001502 [Ambrosia artemisiifolia]
MPFDLLLSTPLWFPFTGFVAMLSAIFTLMVDSMATSMYISKNNAIAADGGNVVTRDQKMAVAGGGGMHFHGHNYGHQKGAIGQQLLCYRVVAMVLELGIVVHSIVIGLGVRASNDVCTIKPLVAALCFHQMFEGMGLGGCILQRDFLTNPENAIRKAYGVTDKTILDKSVDLGRGGSTAVTTILINCKKLVVANVGDSRAVVCRKGVAKQLSIDHEPSKERKHIEDRCGFVSMFPGYVPRVDGWLAVARAFSDKRMKKHLSSEPDVSMEVIDDDSEFIILASDGIWKVMSNQEAVDCIKNVKDVRAVAKQLNEAAKYGKHNAHGLKTSSCKKSGMLDVMLIHWRFLGCSLDFGSPLDLGGD